MERSTRVPGHSFAASFYLSAARRVRTLAERAAFPATRAAFLDIAAAYEALSRRGGRTTSDAWANP